MKITIQSKSSSSDGFYGMSLDDESGFIRCLCYCEAGGNHMMCKHKEAVGRGDASLLASLEDAEKLQEAKKSPAWVAFSSLIATYTADLDDIDKAVDSLKRKRKRMKEIVFEIISRGEDPAKAAHLLASYRARQ